MSRSGRNGSALRGTSAVSAAMSRCSIWSTISMCWRRNQERWRDRIHCGSGANADAGRRQLGIAQPLLNGVPVALFRFHGEQRFQIPDVTALFFDGLLRQLYEVRSDHRNAQRFAILLDAGVFESLGLLFHRATSPVLAARLSNWSYSFICGNGRA